MRSYMYKEQLQIQSTETSNIICIKGVELCRKTSKFLPKICLFIFCIFYLNEKELNQQVRLIKYVENEISNYLPQKKREIEEQKHNPPSKTFLKLLKTFSLVTLLSNCHKLLLLPFAVRP